MALHQLTGVETVFVCVCLMLSSLPGSTNQSRRPPAQSGKYMRYPADNLATFRPAVCVCGPPPAALCPLCTVPLLPRPQKNVRRRKKMKAGVPAHMSVISVRCPYLIGYIEAARKSSSPSPATGQGDVRTYANGSDDDESAGGAGVSKTVVLCLEHANVDTVGLLMRYIYTDEIPVADVPGETLDAVAGLAQELLLPR